MESRQTELCKKLYKTEEEQQIFLGFRILKQEQKETENKAKYFGFFNSQTENRKQSKPKLRNLQRQIKRNNGNIFGLFVFWKAEIRTRITKKAKHGYTKYRQNMICR
jgi:3-methyladenine DNA glycosylase AlkD